MDKKENTNFRPPIVTIMGHVDHGKTTLLDAIFKTNVVAQEHGGITQHIGAYQITYQNHQITFIDTPGHAAFEKMRSRGAEVADIVILAVAANDSVKPQTIEAIKHIKKAQKPIIVAITKVDLENINIAKVKNDLKTNDVLVEGLGGEVPCVEVSALNGKGITDLLEMVNLLWQIKPEPNLETEPLEAVVIESFLDKSKGPIVSTIVKKGKLISGQKLNVDAETITVRALIDASSQNLKEAKPSDPVQILGFKKVLPIGSIINQFIKTSLNLPQLLAKNHAELIAKSLEVKEKFKIILKADVLGSIEAIAASLPEKILIIYSAVGEVQATDVNFAKGAKAPIIAFNVKISQQVEQLATREQVLIRQYKVIYELINDMQEIAESFEKAKYEQKIQGTAKIVAIFNIGDKKIAGCKITGGKIKIGDKVIIKNQSTQTKETKVISIKKFKKETQSAVAGQECGIAFEANLDFKEGDVIESLG